LIFEDCKINLQTIRLRTFFEKGIVCNFCGIKASFFAIVYYKNDKQFPYHLELYGQRKGNLARMTSDHIIPIGRKRDQRIKHLGEYTNFCNINSNDKLCSHCKHHKATNDNNNFLSLEKLGTVKKNGRINYE
jgi:hypothetical protein